MHEELRGHELITSALKKQLMDARHEAAEEDPLCLVKIYNPYGVGLWYLIDLDEDEDTAFGLCCSDGQEIGYVSIKELDEMLIDFQFNDYPFKRMMDFKPRRLSKCKKEASKIGYPS